MKNKTLTLIKHKLQWLALLVALLGVSQGAWGAQYDDGNSRASGIFVTYTSGGTQNSNIGYRINDTANMWVGGCTPKMSKNKDFQDTNFGVVTELKITGGEVNYRMTGYPNNDDYVWGTLGYKIWKSGAEKPAEFTEMFTTNQYDDGRNTWDGAKDESYYCDGKSIDLISIASSGSGTSV